MPISNQAVTPGRTTLLEAVNTLLAGAIMAEGGMATRLINLAKVFVGFIRGGLALVNILASTLFGCISGSSVADTASIGSVMIPQMVKAGYPRIFATNVTICGSVQAILVPPSHNSVIYSIATGGTGGVYYPYGGAIARVISAHLPGVEATAEVTAASVDNLKLIGGAYRIGSLKRIE